MNDTEKHTLKPVSGRIARIAWAAWLSIMLATPYYLLNPYAGARLSGKYTYIAFGLVIGATLVFCLGKKLVCSRKAAKISLIVLTAIAVVASLFLVALEWYRMPVYLTEDAESGFWGPRYWLPWVFGLFPMQGNELIHIFCGMMCSVAGVWAFCESCPTDVKVGHSKSIKASAMESKHARLLTLLPYLLFVGLLVAGFSLRAFFSAFFPFIDEHNGDALDLPAAKFVFTPYLISIPYIYMFVLTLVTEALAKKCVDSFSNTDSAIDPDRLYPMLILAISLGMLCWNGLCHAFPTYSVGLFSIGKLIIALGSFAVVVLVFEVVTLYVLTKNTKPDAVTEHTEVSDIEDEGQIEALAFEGLLSGMPGSDMLTERETEALRLMLNGFSSSESAEKLGLSASTVRQYLSRAYKKLDVANSDEFKELVLRRDLEAEATEEEPVDSSSFESSETASEILQHGMSQNKAEWLKRHARNIISLAGIVFFPIWCFLQKSFTLHQVDARSLMICISWATILWGVWRVFCLIQPEAYSRNLGSRWKRYVSIGWRALLCICGIVTAIAIWLPDDSVFVLKSRFMLGVFFAVFVFTIGCLNGLRLIFTRLKSEKCNPILIIMPALVAVIALMIFSSFDRFVSLAAGIICATCICFYRSCDESHADLPKCLEEHLSYDKPTILLGCAFFAFVGFYADEIGSTPMQFDFVDAGIVFFGLFCVASFIFLLLSQNDIKRRAAVTIIMLAFLMVCMICKTYFALPVVFMVLFMGMTFYKLDETDLAFPIYSAFFGFGTLAAFILVSMFSESLIMNDMLMEIHDNSAFESLFKWEYLVVGVIMIISISIAVAFLLNTLREIRLESGDSGLAKSTENRNAYQKINYFLISKGLSETQALVVYHVSLGKPVSAIANELGYSKGTVKSACHFGYRQLGIHSREELISLLNRELSL